MIETLKKVEVFLKSGGIYLALVAFLALLVAGLGVMEEEEGGLLQLRTARSDFEDYFNAADRMAERGDLYNMEAVRQLKSGDDPGLDLSNPVELLKYSMTPEGKAYLESIRGAGSYLYLPFFAFLILPLSYVGYEVAVLVFQITALFLLWYFFVWIRNHHDKEKREHFWYLTALCMLPVASFLADNAANANVGFYLIFLCGAGLLLSSPDLTGGERQRGSHLLSYAGGALLGLAAVIKIMPVLLGLYLLAHRNFRAIAGAIAAGLLCLVLPALFAGWETNLRWHMEWYDLMINTYSEYGVVRPYANNQTISAALSKLFVAGSDPGRQAAVGLPLFFPTLESLGPEGAFWLRTAIKTIMFGLLGLVTLCALLFSLRRKFSRPDKRLARVYFIQVLILVSLLVSGVSWLHAYSLLLVPLAFRMHTLLPWSKEEKWMVGLIAFSGLGNLVYPNLIRDVLAMYSVHTWLMLVLCIWTMTLVLRILRKEPSYE